MGHKTKIEWCSATRTYGSGCTALSTAWTEVQAAMDALIVSLALLTIAYAAATPQATPTSP